MDGGDDHHAQLAEEWRLHLFQCRDISLYCLSNGISLLVKPLPKLIKKQNSSKDKDDPSSKKDSSKHHRPSTSNSSPSSVPQQGRLSVLAVTEGVACRDGETVELQQIKAKKKIGPFALKKLAKSLFKVCEVHPQVVVFNDRKDAQKMYRFNEHSLVCKETDTCEP